MNNEEKVLSECNLGNQFFSNLEEQKSSGVKSVSSIGSIVSNTVLSIENGSLLGHYEILIAIGSGGMGKVYKAFDTKLHQTVAIKVMNNDSRSTKERERFISEARIMAKLKHPNIVRIHHVGTKECEGSDYIVMDYIEGKSLENVLAFSSIPPRKSLEIMTDVAKAVAYAHDNGIIHRDLKPANIMVDNGGHPIVMDFGLAKDTKDSTRLTKSGAAVGTPRYMSPEQANSQRKLTKLLDVYALGAILYEMLTGRYAVQGSTVMEILYNLTSRDIRPPRKIKHSLSKDVEVICLKALEKDPQKRYQTAQEMAEDMERFLNGEMILARPTPLWSQWYRKLKKYKTIVFLALILVCSICFTVSSYVYVSFLAPGYLTMLFSESKGILAEEITIDGKKIQTKSLNRFPLSAGEHRVAMKFCDYKTLEFNAKILCNKEVTLTQPLAYKQGKISIDSSLICVAHCTNTRTGKKVNIPVPAKGESIEIGDYEVTIEAVNYFPYQTNVSIQKDEETFISVWLKSKELWNIQVDEKSNVPHKIVLADTDGDGEVELVCCSAEGEIKSYNIHTRAGKAIFTNKVQSSRSDIFRMDLTDLDKDGFADFVVAHFDTAWVVDGKTRQELLRIPSLWCGVGLATKDVNQDGYDDLIIFRTYSSSGCYDLRSQKWLWQKKFEIPNETSYKPVFVDEYRMLLCLRDQNDKASRGLYLLDVRTGDTKVFCSQYTDRDGKSSNVYSDRYDIKIISTGQKKIALLYNTQTLFRIDLDTGSGNVIWKTDKGFLGTPGIVLYDTTGDGIPEIFITRDKLYCLSLQGQELWSFDIRTTKKISIPCIADLDHDGTPEAIIYSDSGKLFILNARSGEFIQEFQHESEITDIIPSDVDNDGSSEILFLSLNYIHCIRYAPEKNVKVLTSISNLFAFSPVAGDVDHDGVREIFVVGNNSKKLYCINTRTWQKIWEYTEMSDIIFSPILVDSDKNGLYEILVRYGNPSHSMLDAQGKQLWKYTHKAKKGRCQHRVAGDANHDGKIEIIASSGETIYALDPNNLDQNTKTPKCLWNQSLASLLNTQQYIKIDTPPLLIPGEQEDMILVAPFNILLCLCGKNGEPIWQAKLPQCVNGIGAIWHDVDGRRLLFIPQVEGYISCLEADTGKTIWEKRLLAGGIRVRPIIRNSKDGPELLVSSCAEDVHCLDARTGNVKWYTLIRKKIRTFHDIPFQDFVNTSLIALESDINGDGINDIVCINSQCPFYVLSGKDGSWLGDFSGLCVPDEKFANTMVSDIDKDGKQDIAFVDNRGRLVCIYDIAGYARRMFDSPVYEDTSCQESSLLRMAYWNKLIYRSAYKRLKDDISRHGNLGKYNHILPLYKAVCDLAENKPLKLQEARNPEIKFLQVISYLKEGQTARAKEIALSLSQKSIVDFYGMYQKYKSLISPDLENKLFCLNIKTESLYDFYQAISNFSDLPELKQEALYLLECYLKCSMPGTKEYETAKNEYVQQVENYCKANLATVYLRHRIIEILDHAIGIVPHPELLQLRQNVYSYIKE